MLSKGNRTEFELEGSSSYPSSSFRGSTVFLSSKRARVMTKTVADLVVGVN